MHLAPVISPTHFYRLDAISTNTEGINAISITICLMLYEW